MTLADHPDAIRWNGRYENKSEAGEAVEVLRTNLLLLPKSGDALDLACGLGANAILLANQGLNVSAWDISEVAIEKLDLYAKEHGLNIQTDARDIVNQPPQAEQFDVIVVSYFLDRSLFPHLLTALKPDGLLYYQTFALEGATSGPTNPAFRLDKNELLTLCQGLTIRAYGDDGISGDTFIIAQKS